MTNIFRKLIYLPNTEFNIFSKNFKSICAISCYLSLTVFEIRHTTFLSTYLIPPLPTILHKNLFFLIPQGKFVHMVTRTFQIVCRNQLLSISYRFRDFFIYSKSNILNRLAKSVGTYLLPFSRYGVRYVEQYHFDIFSQTIFFS